jgi:dUTP pyrophosphatase
VLKVKLLHPDAKAPTVGHAGEDLGYDVHALEDHSIPPLSQAVIRTGLAIEFVPPAGARIETKSSIAKLYGSVEGGIIDAGYRGEILVVLYNRHPRATLEIKKGNKFAQLLRDPNLTEGLEVVSELSASEREGGNFGSTGQL